jgi:uncharacterized damage-inducible protein DinB
MIDACERLSDEQLEATVQGTYGSIKATLLHLFGAEERYAARLSGQRDAPPPLESEAFTGVAMLRERAQKTGSALIEVAETFRADSILKGEWRGKPFEMPAMVVMLQAINHATEHRAHIATIMTQQGIEPPSMDAWSYNEAGMLTTQDGSGA